MRGDKTRADGLTAAAGLWTRSPRAFARVGADIVSRSCGDSGATEINSLVLTEQLPVPYLCQVKAVSKGWECY